MNLSDLMNDLADQRIDPGRLPAPEAVRRAGDIKQLQSRRRLALATAAAVASAATGALLFSHGQQRLEPAPAPGLPNRVTIIDASGDVSYVADDGARLTIPAGKVDRFALSPYGLHIAYTTDTGTAQGGRLWIADADGSDPERLPQPCAGCQPGYGVTWSNDGTRLAYVVWTPGRQPAQVRIRTLSTGREKVFKMPTGLEPRGPRFSPDDRILVVNVDSDTGEYVATLDITQTAPALRPLTGSYNQVQLPAWSADGQTIYYTATTSGDNTNDITASIDLYAVGADGAAHRQITHADNGERFFAATPYQDHFLISRALGDGPWTVGWLTDDGTTFTPLEGPDGKQVLGEAAQLQP
jgi:sugar lactone lactonase YvrE